MPAFTLSRRNAEEMDQFTFGRSPDTVHAIKVNHCVASAMDAKMEGRWMLGTEARGCIMVDVPFATSHRVCTCCASSVECHLAGPNNHDLSNGTTATLLILSRSFTLLISPHFSCCSSCLVCPQTIGYDKAELLLLSMLAMIYAAGTPLV